MTLMPISPRWTPPASLDPSDGCSGSAGYWPRVGRSALEGGPEAVERPRSGHPHGVLGGREHVVELLPRLGQAELLAGEPLDHGVGAEGVGLLLRRLVGGVELFEMSLGV